MFRYFIYYTWIVYTNIYIIYALHFSGYFRRIITHKKTSTNFFYDIIFDIVSTTFTQNVPSSPFIYLFIWAIFDFGFPLFSSQCSGVFILRFP